MEETNSISLQDLFNSAKRSNDESHCRTLFEKLRWGDTPYCPHCGCLDKIYRYKDNKLFKCSDCKKQFTVTVGTVFESTHLSFSKLFQAIHHFFLSKKGISSHHLARIIEVQQKTSWLLLQKIRYSISEDKDLMDKLYGLVEVDETFIGGKNRNRHIDKRIEFRNGRDSLVKSIVFGMLERNRRLVKVFVVKDRGADTLQPLIKLNVVEESHIVSDDWVGYSGLDKWYWRTIVNHSAGQYMNGVFGTNTLEGFWSSLKRGIGGVYHSVSKRYLQRYCDEYAFRYNNKKATPLGIMSKVILSSQNKRLRHYECELKLAA